MVKKKREKKELTRIRLDLRAVSSLLAHSSCFSTSTMLAMIFDFFFSNFALRADSRGPRSSSQERSASSWGEVSEKNGNHKSEETRRKKGDQNEGAIDYVAGGENEKMQ